MIACLVAALMLSAPADDVRQAIADKVQAEVGADAEVVVHGVRMGDGRLARGDFEVALSGTSRSGRVKGKILSHGRETWLSAEVEVRTPVVVTTRAIARGETLAADDVTIAKRVRSDGLGERSLVVGAVARWDLAAGEAIASNALDRPMLVRRGDAVSACVSQATFRVSARGEALDSGRLGARVAVRVSDGKVVEGKVVGPGEVEVNP